MAVESSTGFSLALRSTGVVYYQLAIRETDPRRRLELARNALDYLERHFDSARKNSRLREKRREMLGRLNREFPEVSVSVVEAESP